MASRERFKQFQLIPEDSLDVANISFEEYLLLKGTKVKDEPIDEEFFKVTELLEVKEEKISYEEIKSDQEAPAINLEHILLDHSYAKRSHDDDSLYSTSESEEEEVDSAHPVSQKEFLKCPECPLVLENELRLNRHLRLHILPSHQCRSCLKKFKRVSSLLNHVCDLKCLTCLGFCTCTTVRDPANCRICQEINFRYFTDYKIHMLTHNQIISCEVCESKNFTLYRHKLLKHTVTTLFKCGRCLKICETKEELAEHRHCDTIN